MKAPAALYPLFLLLAVPCAAQNVEVRKEAVRLLERASEVSLSPKWPNLERRVTFRVLDSSVPVREGTFTRVVVQGVGRREEYNFGDFQMVNVFTEKGLATTASGRRMVPPDMAAALRLTPIYLLHFDDSDVIRSIKEKSIGGRAARCIEFDTITGEKTQNNEACVDPAQGTLLYAKLGNELIENSQFFEFAGAWIPGRITYAYAGVPKLEISQSMTELKETENVLAAPPDAKELKACTTYRRAIGKYMPQPKPGSSGRDTEILVRGIIDRDGRVRQAAIQASDRPDLNAEALEIVAQWEFTPAMCEGRPNPSQANIVIRFRGR